RATSVARWPSAWLVNSARAGQEGVAGFVCRWFPACTDSSLTAKLSTDFPHWSDPHQPQKEPPPGGFFLAPIPSQWLARWRDWFHAAMMCADHLSITGGIRMTSSQRPPFLYPPGSVLMHSPLSLGKSQMYGFYVKGDLSTLQQSVDASLNQCTQGKMQFRVLTPYVMLSFTDVTHANSEHPTDKAKGWGQETDIVTWVMVGQVLAGES